MQKEGLVTGGLSFPGQPLRAKSKILPTFPYTGEAFGCVTDLKIQVFCADGRNAAFFVAIQNFLYYNAIKQPPCGLYK